MSTRLRVQVTVTYPMMVAMRVLADRSGNALSTQAALILRQALSRTIESAEVQRRVRDHNAQRTSAEWQEETMTERAVELAHEREEASGRAIATASEVESEGWQRALHDVASYGLAHQEGEASS